MFVKLLFHHEIINMKYTNCLLVIIYSITIIGADLSSFSNGHGFILNDFPQECTTILNVFAQSASNFTLCSIQNARPVRLCENCVDNYMSFHEKYQQLLDTSVNGTSCQSLFISKDRLDVVLEYHNSILAIWNKGNCNACFTWTGEGPVLSNKTKQFNVMYNETMECIVENYKQNNSEEVCEKCMTSYITLDDFYKTLSTDSIGVDSVCMDVVDSMNATRFIWSKDLSCCKLRKTPEIVFLCCTGIISCLPILYYLAVRFCGPIRDLPNVLKQSRFKQTFLRSINRSDRTS